MLKERGNLMKGVGARLRKLREKHGYSLDDMAARLGLKGNSYYKNESDATLPGVPTLHKLYTDFGLSMNWLLFGHGPMLLGDIPEREEQEPAQEIKELLACMTRDPLLRHKILMSFYEHKDQGKE